MNFFAIVFFASLYTIFHHFYYEFNMISLTDMENLFDAKEVTKAFFNTKNNVVTMECKNGTMFNSVGNTKFVENIDHESVEIRLSHDFLIFSFLYNVLYYSVLIHMLINFVNIVQSFFYKPVPKEESKGEEKRESQPKVENKKSKSLFEELTSMLSGKECYEVINPMDITTTFSEIIGLQNVKDELKEYTKFMKYMDEYIKMGCYLPKGLLFVGMPGTGKTYMARAFAKECGATFISTTGSNFDEKYVGVGAERVRSMFKYAKEHSPCIIFIDEIDAVGSRHQNDNKSMQTINQLLSELDGIVETKGIMCIAATNFDDKLDPAILRSGRFDKKIAFDLPNFEERSKMFHMYLKKVKIHETYHDDGEKNGEKNGENNSTSELSNDDKSELSSICSHEEDNNPEINFIDDMLSSCSENEESERESEEDNIVETAGEDNIVKTAGEDNIVKTTGEDNIVETSGEDNIVETTGEDNVVKTTGEDNIVKTTGEDNIVKTADDEKLFLKRNEAQLLEQELIDFFSKLSEKKLTRRQKIVRTVRKYFSTFFNFCLKCFGYFVFFVLKLFFGNSVTITIADEKNDTINNTMPNFSLNGSNNCDTFVKNKKRDVNTKYNKLVKKMAERTTMMSGADIKNICNTALFIHTKKYDEICENKIVGCDEKELLLALDDVMIGIEKKERKMTTREKKIVAYHECGHAIISSVLHNGNVPLRATIIPRGKGSLGHTLHEQKDSMLQFRSQMLIEILILLGGRAAEEIITEDYTSGATNDFDVATTYASNYVKKYNMMDGKKYYSVKELSQNLKDELNSQTINLLNKSYEKTLDILRDNKKLLKNMAYNLYKKETLERSEILELFSKHDTKINSIRINLH